MEMCFVNCLKRLKRYLIKRISLVLLLYSSSARDGNTFSNFYSLVAKTASLILSIHITTCTV